MSSNASLADRPPKFHLKKSFQDLAFDATREFVKKGTANSQEHTRRQESTEQRNKPITESPKELLKRVEKEHQTRPESPTRKTEQQLEATEETSDSNVVANHELALQPQETAQTARFFEDFKAFEDLFGLRGQAQQPHIPQAAPFYRIPNPDLYEEQEFAELDPFPQPSQPLPFIEQTRNPETSIDAIPLPITPAFSDHDIATFVQPQKEINFLEPQTLERHAKPIAELFTAMTKNFTEKEAQELAKIFKNETIIGLQINGPTIAVATQNRATGTPSVFTIDTSRLRQPTHSAADALPGVQSKPALPAPSTPPIRPIAPAIEQPALPNRAMPLTPTLPAAPEASLPPLQAPEIVPTDFVDELFDLPLLDIPAPDHDTLPIVLPTEEPMPFIRQAITPPLPARTAPASARTIADPRRIMPRRMPTTIPRPLPIAIPRRMPARRAVPPAPALIAPEEPLEEDIAILPIELPKLNNPIKTIEQRQSDHNHAIHQSDQPYKHDLSHDNSNQYSSLMPSEPVTKTPGNHAAHSISLSPTYQRPSASTFNTPYASASQPTKQSSPTEQNLDKTVTNKVVVINNYRPENAAAKPNDSKPFIKAESAPAQTHDISGYGFSY